MDSTSDPADGSVYDPAVEAFYAALPDPDGPLPRGADREQYRAVHTMLTEDLWIAVPGWDDIVCWVADQGELVTVTTMGRIIRQDR